MKTNRIILNDLKTKIAEEFSQLRFKHSTIIIEGE